MLLVVAIGLFGYLCGSIPFGKLIAKQYGIDIQKRGSGNIGFANVLRVLGWKAAIPVLMLDILKGFIPTYAALLIIGAPFAFVIGLCAVAGHLFPVWLKFKGGKGIATGLGALLGVTPLIGSIALLIYVLSSILIKNSSYASILAGCSVIVSGVIYYPEYTWAYTLFLLVALWTLRKNLFGTVPNYDI